MPVDPSKLYRSTFAMRAELQQPLQRAVELSGANSTSDLLARLARSPEDTAAALRPIFERQDADRGTIKGVSAHAAARALKEAELSPEQLARLIELAKTQAPDVPPQI